MKTESSVENINDVTRRIKVAIPLERVKQETEIALNEAAKNAHIKGFRPGKAPKDIIEKTHGARVRLEVANRLISSTLGEVIREHELDMIGSPEIEMADYQPDHPIEYTATVSLYPKPEIGNIEKIKVQLRKQEVKDSDVEQVLENMRKSKATLKKLDFRDTVEPGDVVDALISVEKDGKTEGRPEPLVIEVGEGRIKKELEDALIGMKIGETKKVENTPQEAAGESNFSYVITLQSISERILPEANDEFVKSLQLESQTLLELRMEIRKNLEQSIEKNKESELHAEILKYVVGKNSFQVPQLMIDNEIYNLLMKSGQIKADQEVKIEDYRETFGEIADYRVKSAVAVDRIADQENIELKEEEIQKELSDMAQSYNVTKEEMMGYLQKNNILNGFLTELRRSKAIDSLVARTEVEYLPAEDAK